MHEGDPVPETPEPKPRKPRKSYGRPRGRPRRARHVTTLREQESVEARQPEPEPVTEPVREMPSVSEEPPLRRFWKPKRSLPSVEWDKSAGTADAKTGVPSGAARFEFRHGLFETRDQGLAEELIRKGYLEIPEGVVPPAGPPGDDLPADR